ncbi:MAG: phosphate regulon transcriptional regulator PhoB [Burkholderiales bacterium]|nr:phosphate regulon transcriptional regulator PhoB [Rhodocyclaceae bacterium]MCA3021822.1 phosphate regulon transcriptional regulator PhoB [Rhodocyclaceae bacterium]MCA3034006.1 phosphate regulon transcriptional regulator PhoB [Rhodocyclaceae bacterium]MCA3052978.1 phosphate regulon transcriptional regulator PhoB [Rhodocyclaceae bacterium]
MNPTILVVEDEPAIQDLIQINLEMGGYRVLVTPSAEGALKIVQHELPDLALLDWMLPGMSGVELTRKLRGDSRTKSLPVILLTARGEEADKLRGLETGADDYMVKPFSLKELEARIKAVLRRRAPELTEDTIEYNGLKLDPASHKVTGNGQTLTMGPTEFRLLHFFLTHLERVYSRTQLLDFVWGDHVFIEERTVDVHIRRLRSALAPSGHDNFVHTVRGSGYRFARDE